MKYKNLLDKEAVFVKIDESEIVQLENALGFCLPYELKAFYKKVGYCYLNCDEYTSNTFLKPSEVRDFRLKKGIYKYYPEMRLFEEYESDKLMFFECNESHYLSMEIKETGDCKIYWCDIVIALSLSDFIQKIQKNEDYFFELIQEGDK